MIRARVNAFRRAFHSIPHTLCYSVKANSTLGILRVVAGEGPASTCFLAENCNEFCA
jgi:diaminopimelate decarboxylase